MREGRELTMEVFTIIANEVIGLSATECTLIQFSVPYARYTDVPNAK